MTMPKELVHRPVVYFVASDDHHEVKIGYTNRNLYVRLSALRSHSPAPLYIYGYFETRLCDLKKIEKRLHDIFKSHHSHGEWFHLNDDTKAMIEDVVFLGPSVLPEEFLLEQVLT